MDRIIDFAVDYQAIAASQAATGLGGQGGGSGAKGDILTGILVVPATLSPGAITVTDGAGSAITVFTGGATSVVDLKPFYIDLGRTRSTSGAWKVATGANVSVIAYGWFH